VANERERVGFVRSEGNAAGRAFPLVGSRLATSRPAGDRTVGSRGGGSRGRESAALRDLEGLPPLRPLNSCGTKPIYQIRRSLSPNKQPTPLDRSEQRGSATSSVIELA
jgi:hypothetical protein